MSSEIKIKYRGYCYAMVYKSHSFVGVEGRFYEEAENLGSTTEGPHLHALMTVSNPNFCYFETRNVCL